MTNSVKSMCLRALVILAAGIVLIAIPHDAVRLMAQIGGGLLLLLGLVAILSVFRKEKGSVESVLMGALGLATGAFGIVLLVRPMPFVDAIVYILGALLIVAGAFQLFIRYQMHVEGIRVSGPSYVLPVVTFAAGLLALIQPGFVADLLPRILGAGCVAYALLELWSAWQIHAFRRAQAKALAECDDEEMDAVPEPKMRETDEEAIERAQREAETGIESGSDEAAATAADAVEPATAADDYDDYDFAPEGGLPEADAAEEKPHTPRPDEDLL
ncbi:MAG: DUF308 domain-containing protein [Alloprevotella sp.]|nr:DUF308 domain-containing protein [Alloprevotella sp.]